MMSTSQTTGATTPKARTLEYRQAMKDFHTMFPSLEKDVIECVLRANNGHVDSTIDQLLQITKDSSHSRNSRRLYHTYDDSTDSSCSISPELRDRTSSSEDDLAPPRYTPRREAPPPNVYNFSRQPVEASFNEKTSRPTSHRKTYKDWNPPLLGALPHDFLRLPRSHAASRSHEHKPSSAASRSNSRRSLNDASTRSRGSNSSHANHQLQRRRTTGQLNVVVNRPADRHRPSQQRMVMVDTSQEPRTQRPHTSSGDARRSRRTTSDQDQYNEDRKIALLLQNEEFMKELKLNDEFLKELNRDDRSSHARPRETAPANPRDKFSSIHIDPLAEISPEQSSGPIDGAAEDDAFQESVRHMSKSAKKTFNEIAKRFTRRKHYKSMDTVDPIFANCPEDAEYR